MGGSCATAASDSCSDSNAQCVGGTCECNAGYYDDDGISNNNAGTCTLRKCHNCLVYLRSLYGRIKKGSLIQTKTQISLISIWCALKQKIRSSYASLSLISIWCAHIVCHQT